MGRQVLTMKILKAYKTELDPNNKQRAFFRQCAGTARFVFNWALDDRQQKYKDGEKTSQYEQRKRFNALKREQLPWITAIPYAVTESAFSNCDSAFQSFFRRVKSGETPGYPKFKARGIRDSFQLRNTRVYSDCVRLTHIGLIRLKEHGYIPESASRYGTYATVSKRAGRWFISVLVEEDAARVVTNGKIIGVDFGVKDLAVCSNGKVFENPRHLQVAERKLKRLQRELSRRTKDGANWRKTKTKLQKAHFDVANARRHTQHEISSYLTHRLKPSVIVLENLNVDGMMKNHRLAQAIGDVGFYELRRQIEYKARWCGIEVVLADRWYPSTKTCSRCGAHRPEITLSHRVYHCSRCGLEINRDLNAAKNLAALVGRQADGDCLGS
jgi:putative transposase